MMKLILVALLVVLISCIAPASAVRVGGGFGVYPDPVPVGTVAPNMTAVHYYPLGYHLMTPSINPQWNSLGIMDLRSVYYFGRDFDLGMIDNNYAGAPFILQVLADP